MSSIKGFTRRGALKAGLATIASSLLGSEAASAPVELRLPDGAVPERESFEGGSLGRWQAVSGHWQVESLADENVFDAPGGKRVLMQRSIQNTFNVIVAPFGPYADADVSVKFKPISGQEDASGGIVFRFSGGRYYLIRANALEDNFRFYYYDGSRHMLGSARVAAPALGKWHALRAIVAGDRVQGWLNGALLLDYRDNRFKAGSVGLWTKADSVTAFDEFAVRGVASGRD